MATAITLGSGDLPTYQRSGFEDMLVTERWLLVGLFAAHGLAGRAMRIFLDAVVGHSGQASECWPIPCDAVSVYAVYYRRFPVPISRGTTLRGGESS